MRKIFPVFKVIIIAVFFLFFARNTFAEKYDLIAPSGTLQRGQVVTFTINIDTQGKKLTSSQIGMTYKTEYLEFVSTNPGDTFSVVTSTPAGTGRLLISATEPSGFSGQGVFAEVKLKIIATAPGETELCVLWNPITTTIVPTSVVPTTIGATNAAPTQLPRSGNAQTAQSALVLGLIFTLTASILLIFSNKNKLPN